MNTKQTTWLLTEINSWQAENLINADQAATLRQRYLALANKPPQNYLQIIISIIGSILIAAGIITILAFNWDNLPQAIRIFIAFLPLVISQLLVVFVFKNKMANIAWREGAAIFNAGGVLASMAMISQVFHLSGSLDTYFLISALLFLPTIYLLDSASPLLIYYTSIWLYQTNHFSIFNSSSGFKFPTILLLSCLALPFVIRRFQQKIHFGASYLSWTTYFNFVAAIIFTFTLWEIQPFLGILSIAILSLCLALTYPEKSFIGPFALGNLGTYVILLFLTNNFSWSLFSYLNEGVAIITPLVSIIVLFFGGYFLSQKAKAKGQTLTSCYILVLVAVGIFISILTMLPSTSIVLLAPVSMNIIVALLGIFLIYRGIQEKQPNHGSEGLALICILIILRFFDADIDLLAKGVAFICIGTLFLLANQHLSKKIKVATGGQL